MMRIAMITTALALSAPPASAKVYKKIDKGVGNCIFSSAPMPKDKEDEFKVASSFKAGDDIYVRCYFGKTVKEMSLDGKLTNSLRGPVTSDIGSSRDVPAWYAAIVWGDDKANWWYKNTMVYTESTQGTWLQQRFDQPFGGTKETCDWKMAKFDQPDNCVDIEKETRNLGAKLNKTGTYTPEICIDIYYEKVDKTKITTGLKEVEVVESMQMAKGCFNYTVEL